MRQSHFRLKPLVISIATIIGQIPLAQAAYQQGEGEYAAIHKGDLIQKIESVSEPKNEKEKVTGEFNRTGIPVRVIWYGRPGDQDGEVAQKGADNEGVIRGKVSARGKTTTADDDYSAGLAIDAQGNGIDALGWSAPANKRDIDITLEHISNTGYVSAAADIQGGDAMKHGDITVYSAGNGISLAGLADFGANAIVGNAGIGNVVGGVSIGSGVAVSTRSVRARSAAMRSVGTRSVGDPMLAVATRSVETTAKKGEGVAPQGTIEHSDFYGKDIQVKLSALNNTGSISAKLEAQANQQNQGTNINEYNPQFYTVRTAASGNGVGVSSFVSTIDKYTYSDEKKLSAIIEDVNNSGSIKGSANLKGGRYKTHTVTESSATGNGIAVLSTATSFAKHSPISRIDKVNNSGNISGALKQVSGDNAPPDKLNYEPSHLYANANAYGSGNGISVQAVARNGQTKRAIAKIGDVVNEGRIEGDGYVKAGNGYGELNVKAIAVGNGISSSLHAGSVGNAQAALGNLINSGLIKGSIETHAGKVANFAKDVPDALLKPVITTAKNNSTFSQPKQTPDAPDTIPPRYVTLPWHEKQTHSVSEVYGSGNGVSVYADRSTDTQRSVLGNIDNSGVISGHASLYHGFNNDKYARVDFISAGSGIAIDNELRSDISNAGIISGNISAISAKGRINDAYSSSNPDFVTGIKGKVNNYGILAGRLIYGSYDLKAVSGDQFQQYRHFEPNCIDNNVGTCSPLDYKNMGLYITLDDDETIKKVEVGNDSEPTYEKDGQKYSVINAALDSTSKDSSHELNGNLEHTIVNGIGFEKGALFAASDATLTDSIVNGYANAIELNNDVTLALDNTIVNANGFAVLNEQGNSIQPLAVKGSAGREGLILQNKAIVNGNVDMSSGDDSITITGNELRLNGDVDMGEGRDTLKTLSAAPMIVTTAASVSTEEPIKINGTFLNTEEVSVLSNTVISAQAKITGADTVVIAPNKKLVYEVTSDDEHAFYDTNAKSDIELTGGGEFMLDVLGVTKSGMNVDMTVGVSEQKKFILNKADSTSISSNSVLHNVVLNKDGQFEVAIKTASSEQNGTGSGNAGSGNAGSGNAGSGNAGSGNSGSGNSGSGNAGSGNAGSGNAGSGNAGSGNAGSGNVGSGNAGSGNSGSGNAGSGNVGSGDALNNNTAANGAPSVSNKSQSQSTMFVTPYPDVYNSFVKSMSQQGINFLKNSASVMDKPTKQAEAAVNDYFKGIKDENIYGAIPKAMAIQHSAYRQNMRQHELLNQNDVEVEVDAVHQSQRYNHAAKSAKASSPSLSVAYGITPTFTAGGQIGTTSHSIDGFDGSYMKGHDTHIGLFAINQVSDDITVKGGVQYEAGKLKGSRQITNGYDAHVIPSNVSPSITSIYALGEYRLPVSSNAFDWHATAGLAYSHYKQSAVSENHVAGLNIEDYSNNLTELMLGTQIGTTLPIASGQLTGQLNIDYIKPIGAEADLNASFRNSSAFSINTLHADDSINIGANLGYQFGGGLNTEIGIRKSISNDSNEWAGNIGIKYTF